MNQKFIKLVISFLLVGSYFFLPKYGFTAFNYTLTHHLLYPLSHANIWHLAANILCLWMLPCRTHIFATFVMAVLCSFLPCPLLPLYGESAAFTMGFSGVLFAMVGISWGKVGRFREMLRRNKWYLIIPAFLPHVNFLIHIYCLLAGYLYGMLCAKKSKLS
jgi:membrane associated rhomboid family serine protease